MALDELNRALAKARLSTHVPQLEIPGPELFDSLSENGKVFLRLIANVPTGGGTLTLEQCTLHDWEELDRDSFWHLAHDEQLEILATLSAVQHEWTHHLDLLATPFGVNVQVKEIIEYQVFERIVPDLLARPECLSRPLVDWLTEAVSPGWWIAHPDADLASFEALTQALAGKVLFDDYVIGAYPRRVDQGWIGNTERAKVGGRQYQRVTVNSIWASVKLREGTYFGPYELLEGRALALSLRRLLYVLGEDDRAMRVMADFMETFYSEQPRYHLLLELVAGIPMGEVLSTWKRPFVEQLLMLVQIVSWYALYAPPPTGPDDVLTAMPVARLLHALSVLANKGLGTHTVATDFLDSLDREPFAVDAGFVAANEALDICLQWNGNAASVVKDIGRAGIAEHFNHVLAAQWQFISDRRGDGYASRYGNPETGNPLEGMVDENSAKGLDWLSTPSDEVLEWFDCRNKVLYKQMDADARGQLLHGWFH
jgi:hypothetical protein